MRNDRIIEINGCNFIRNILCDEEEQTISVVTYFYLYFVKVMYKIASIRFF